MVDTTKVEALVAEAGKLDVVKDIQKQMRAANEAYDTDQHDLLNLSSIGAGTWDVNSLIGIADRKYNNEVAPLRRKLATDISRLDPGAQINEVQAATVAIEVKVEKDRYDSIKNPDPVAQSVHELIDADSNYHKFDAVVPAVQHPGKVSVARKR